MCGCVRQRLARQSDQTELGGGGEGNYKYRTTKERDRHKYDYILRGSEIPRTLTQQQLSCLLQCQSSVDNVQPCLCGTAVFITFLLSFSIGPVYEPVYSIFVSDVSRLVTVTHLTHSKVKTGKYNPKFWALSGPINRRFPPDCFTWRWTQFCPRRLVF
jgi:hypothetical protein